MKRWNFYRHLINKYLKKSSSILIIGASSDEIKLFKNEKFTNITVGYFDDRELIDLKKIKLEYDFEIHKVDARKINFENQSFEYCLTHATIHHIDLPHLAITELYRVSKLGTLIIEGNDSIVMRIATKFGFSEEYENSSISDMKGGLLNSGLPNYIYRWSEREIYKLLNSYNPNINHQINFIYSHDFKNAALEKNLYKKIVKYLLSKFLYIIFLFFKKQKNLVGIFIDKESSKKRY